MHFSVHTRLGIAPNIDSQVVKGFSPSSSSSGGNTCFEETIRTFLCNLADEKEESLPSVSKPFVSCNSLLSSLLERRRDAFIVHLASNHRLLYELAVNPPVSSTQMHQGHGRSLGPVPSTHLQKPPWEDASPSHPAKARKTARQASKIGPSGSRAQSQMGRAL